MMNDLVTWLRVQLDDDERIAREAGSRALTWSAKGTWYLEGVEHNVVGEEEAFCHPHNVEHFTRHDPARVLRRAAADRRILVLHADPHECPEWDRPLGETCTGYYGAEGCPTLRLLALPYAGRDGYRSEWAPA